MSEHAHARTSRSDDARQAFDRITMAESAARLLREGTLVCLSRQAWARGMARPRQVYVTSDAIRALIPDPGATLGDPVELFDERIGLLLDGLAHCSRKAGRAWQARFTVRFSANLAVPFTAHIDTYAGPGEATVIGWEGTDLDAPMLPL